MRKVEEKKRVAPRPGASPAPGRDQFMNGRARRSGGREDGAADAAQNGQGGAAERGACPLRQAAWVGSGTPGWLAERVPGSG